MLGARILDLGVVVVHRRRQAYMWFLTSRYLSTIVGKSLVVIERGTHVYADIPG